MPVLGQRSELEAQLIDWQIVLPRVVLERACEKTLREEESRQPEGLRVAIIDPMLHEIERRGHFMLQESFNSTQLYLYEMYAKGEVLHP